MNDPKHKMPPPVPPHISSPRMHLLWFALTSTCIKLLLIPTYHSTDFEVHRNWLAITHSLPLSQWYSDETSEWTLDYPPFFAYFERFLSFFASMVDPTMTDLNLGINYKSTRTIMFQRLSVIVADFVLVYAAHRVTKSRKLRLIERMMVWAMIIWSPMLIIVDHVHFQYNGFLLGLLLISLSALEEGNDLFGGFVFAILICFKHLFAVAAPVYFVYLFRHYCRGGLIEGFRRFIFMGITVVAVFVAAYGPFVYSGQIQQVFRRMFPFGRGLCHAYWAPNFWVFYIILDKFLAFSLKKFGFQIPAPAASFTGGLVGDSSPFAVLPTITPLISLVVVLSAICPCIIKAWRKPQPRMIIRWVAYAYSCGFLFGWHVHEKALLHFVIPLATIAMQSVEDAKHYLFLSIVSCYSLFTLLFEAQEYLIKVLVLLLHALLLWSGFSSYFATSVTHKANSAVPAKDKSSVFGLLENSDQFIGWFGKCYLLGLVLVEVWGQVLHPIILGRMLPFLPLMMISTYCALGILYSWIWQLRYIIRSD